MDVSSAASSPVSTAIEPAPPQQNAQLSSPPSQNSVSTSGNETTGQQNESSTTSRPDPNARVGSTIDTFA